MANAFAVATALPVSVSPTVCLCAWVCVCVHRELSGMQGGVGVGVTVRAHWADYEFAAKMQTSAIEL